MLFGYTEEEMFGKSIDIIIPKENVEEGEIDRMRAITLSRGFLRNFETIRKIKNGALISVAITQSPLKDARGNLIGYSVIYRDISRQKRFEEELQSRFEKIQNAYLEMGKQRRYIDYLNELLDMASSKHQPEDIIVYIANAFMIIGQVDLTALYIYKNGMLEMEALSGGGHDWWGKKCIEMKGSVFETAYELRKEIKIIDVQSEENFPLKGLVQKYDLRSLLLIPFFYKDEFLGMASFYVKSGQSVSALDNEFLMLFAKQATLVLKQIKTN